MAGGGASVIYADTVSGASTMHGLYSFPLAESMELYMLLMITFYGPKTLLLMPYCLLLVGRRFGLCI